MERIGQVHHFAQAGGIAGAKIGIGRTAAVA